MLVTPYYNKPTQRGLILHHRAIAEAVDIPQLLYNVPGRTACDMQADTVAELAKVPTVCGSLREAVNALKADHEFLTAGDVFTVDAIEAYIDLKMEEIDRYETMPHPIEFEMYYSA